MSRHKDESFLDSAVDAFRLGNIFLRVVLFLVFGLITATPYLVKNFDAVPSKVAASGATGFWVVLEFFKALTATTLKGACIGLSSFADALLNISVVVGERRVGTILFGLVVVGFATAALFQPVRLFFNVIDMEKGRNHSSALIAFFSFVFVVVVAAPLCWLFTGGETITSMIDDDASAPADSPIADEAVPEDQETDDDSGIIKSINMLEGGA